MKKIVIGENIVKSFGEGNEKNIVLHGVSTEISEGEFVAIMGPSGSGKTTLMFALSGMDMVDNGTVKFSEQDLSILKEEELADLRRTRMGFVFQQPTLLKNLNILDNIILPTQRGNEKNAVRISDKARSLMEKMGIKELAKRSVTQVSGGQLQRAGICRALMGDPDIIFGDEPTGALNSKSTEEIMSILGEINRAGTAILLVTHDAKVAAHAQRILFMRDGNIVSELELPTFDGSEVENRTEIVSKKMRENEI